MRLKNPIELFYLATPLFVAVDFVVGMPARAAGLPNPEWRVAYYALLGGCWWLCRTWPGLSPVVGLVEGSTNLTILFVSVLLPIWGASEAVMGGNVVASPMSPAAWWNLGVVAPVLILAIKSNEGALRRAAQEVRTG